MGINQLSIVIPVYNEMDNVAQLSKEIIDILCTQPDIEYEIVFVDDCSTDNTLKQLQQLRAQHAPIHIVQHQQNYGQSAAIISGVKHARYPFVATLDGDGQNDPADLITLITAIAEQQLASKSFLVVGNRKNRKDSFVRTLSSKIANTVRSFCLRDNCPDTGCGLKLFPRQVFLSLPHFRNCHRFLPALFKTYQAVVVNVPVNHRPRMTGKSKYGIHNRLWVGIVDLIGVAWLIRRPVLVERNQHATDQSYR